MPENELIPSTPPVDSTPPVVDSGIQESGIPPAEPGPDVAPDPAALKAEVERLEAARKKAEEDAKYWRQEKARARAEYFKGGKEERAPSAPADDLGIGPEPKQDAFDDYQKYLDAKIAFEVNKARVDWDRQQSRKSQEATHQQKMEKLQTAIQDGFTKYPDFEEVAMHEAVPITPLVMEILADSDRPADVAYYLGKNRTEAIQIARMTPIQAARAVAKIEMEIAKAGPGTPPPQKNVSNAPPPIRPSPGAAHTIEKDPEKMSQKEYEDWRVAQGARRF